MPNLPCSLSREKSHSPLVFQSHMSPSFWDWPHWMKLPIKTTIRKYSIESGFGDCFETMPGNNNFNAQHGYGMPSLHHFGGLGDNFMGSARQEVISNPSWGNFDTLGLSGIRRTWGSQWDSRAHPDSMGFFQIPPFDFSLVRPLQTYWWLVGIREFGCESKPFLSRAAPPPPCYIPLCRGLLLHTFVANDWCRYALQKNLVAKVLVASQEILLQTYVAGWRPKPVTNPMFLIHSHIIPT